MRRYHERLGNEGLVIRRRLLAWFFALSLGFLAIFPVLVEADGGEKAHAKEKPNILFLFADDLSYEAIREFGHVDIDTPNLDKLVKSGTTFTHAYNMGSWSPAVCIASRTMLATGLSVWRSLPYDEALRKKPGNLAREAALQVPLWPQRMSDAGYETWISGKWHVRAEPSQRFDHVENIRGGMPKDSPEGYLRPIAGQPDAWSPSDPKFGGYWEGGEHWSEVVADDVERFLADAARSDKPFFIYSAFNAAHDPRQSPQEYVDRYPQDRIPMPENFLPLYPHKDIMECGEDLRDERLAPFPRTELAVKVQRGEYYALITHLDDQIGRILTALEATGQAENTWIIFTADHGLAVGHHGLFGKQNMFEDSLRVPFVICGPGVEAGKRITAPIYLQDVMATALDIAGAAADPERVEFQSLLPLLCGEGEGRKAIYGAYLQWQRAVIEDGWKLILYPGTEPGATDATGKKVSVTCLYHVAEDPMEMRDLASDPAQMTRKKALFSTLQRLQVELEDPLDIAPFYPELQ